MLALCVSDGPCVMCVLMCRSWCAATDETSGGVDSDGFRPRDPDDATEAGCGGTGAGASRGSCRGGRGGSWSAENSLGPSAAHIACDNAASATAASAANATATTLI